MLQLQHQYVNILNIKSKEVNMKKIIASALIANMIVLNTGLYLTPAQCKEKQKIIKSSVSEYKIDYVNMAWWKDYNDEILDDYIARALSNNYDLKIATLKIEEAKQQVKMQFSKELPSATIGAAPVLLKNEGVTNTTGLIAYPMMVSYEADIFLKNHDKTKSVKKLYEVSKINERSAYISVASAVGATYFNIVKLDKVISLQNEIISSRKQIFELMKIRNEEGITSTADMIKAEKSYILAQTELYDLEKTRNSLLNALAVLIGESPENINELKRISYDELSSKRGIPNEISSETIVQRPDYLIAEKQVEKAGLDVRIAKKEFLPNINVMGLLMMSTSSAVNSISWANTLAAFGGGAMLPIFTGGAKIANLKLHKNKYEQVLQTYYKTNLTAIEEVNNALCALKLDDEKYQKNVKTLEMEKQDFQFTNLRYNQGVISKLDLLQKQENLLVMNKLVATNKVNCYIDQIGLYKATGAKI